MRFLMGLLLFSTLLFAKPLFIHDPLIEKISASSWKITFELSSATDVEVAIVDMRDSSYIRHLAAGKLGANPPSPLIADSLRQTLIWDGLNDAGLTVAGMVPGVRVRAGMQVSQASVYGDNPYRYLVDVYGMTLDSAGNLYVLGQYGHLNLESDHGASVMNALRKYSPDGTYLRTLYPLPAGTPLATASPYGVIASTSGSWRPVTTYLDGPSFGDANAPINGMGAILTTEFRNGKMLICNYPYLKSKGGLSANKTMNWMTFDTLGKGVVTSPLPFISNFPVIFKSQAAGPWFGGPLYITPSPDGTYYLVSGVYQTDTSITNTLTSMIPTDTGVWRDGQILKVDRNTGIATSWLSFKDVPRRPEDRVATVGPATLTKTANIMDMFGCIHGTAMDDSGHVFVCDRLHKRIAIYDVNANLLDSIPVEDPDLVVVSRKSGALYVFSRNILTIQTSYSTLRKYATWRNNPKPVITLPNFPQKTWGKFHAVLSEVGEKPLLWVASYGAKFDSRDPQDYNIVADTQNGIWALRDDGTKFTVVTSFSANSKGAVRGFDRIAVDRKTERLYVNDSWHGLYKNDDWSAPKFVRCSTSTKKYLDGIDASVGNDGYLYVREGKCCSPGGHFRYTQDPLHAPVNYANGSNKLDNVLGNHEGAGASDRGHDITSSGQVGTIKKKGNLCNYASWSPVPGDTTEDTLMTVLPEFSGGFQWGPDGNAYIGVLLRSPDHVIPPEYATDWAYSRSVGAVVKVAKGARAWADSEAMPTANRKVYNALYVYKTGLAPFSYSGTCVCRSPRFEVDPYGRLFVPNAITGKVTVTDNNDNPILTMGEYGNTDSRGMGSLVPEPAIPLMWPTGVTTSENYIYVTDMGNERVARIKMDFQLDNMPGLSTESKKVEGESPFTALLSVGPNPLNPSCQISLLLSRAATIDLAIYDPSGRLVSRVAQKEARSAGRHLFTWNAASAASGVYLLRLNTGTLQVAKRIVLMR